MTVYEEHGYKNRKDYLKNLAEENGAEYETVLMLAQLLGPTEDFDGLVNMIEDAAEMGEFE
jgi:hypothetical protein